MKKPVTLASHLAFLYWLFSFTARRSLLPAFLLFPFLLFSQRFRLEPSKSYWLPAPVKHLDYSKGAYYGYSRTQQQSFYNNMARMMEIVHQTPFLNPPRGYTVGVYASNCPNGCDKGLPLRGYTGFIIRAYYYIGTNPKLELDAEGPSLNFYCNDIGILLSPLAIKEDEYFPEPQIDIINGQQVYNHKYVVLTNNKAPLFSYVTKEEYLKTSIRKKEQNLAELRSTLDRPTPYRQWLANKDANLKVMQEGNQWLAKTDPGKARENKEKYLKGMAETEDRLKAGEAEFIRQRQQMLDKAVNEIAAIRTQLAALDATEKKEPTQELNGKKLVAPNRQFFDPALPVDAIQLIVVDQYKYRGRALEGRFTHEAMKVIQETLDLSALEALLP